MARRLVASSTLSESFVVIKLRNARTGDAGSRYSAVPRRRNKGLFTAYELSWTEVT